MTKKSSGPFNSLSRDHIRRAEEGVQRKDRHFQLPLSGSLHEFRVDVVVDLDRRFQLPLSGSREELNDRRAERGDEPFNSLSRDHERRGHARYGLGRLPLFQLPLSGSRASPRTCRVASDTCSFQLPLSGSHRLRAIRQTSSRSLTFISLSRDHRARFRDFPALRGVLPRRPFAHMNFETAI